MKVLTGIFKGPQSFPYCPRHLTHRVCGWPLGQSFSFLMSFCPEMCPPVCTKETSLRTALASPVGSHVSHLRTHPVTKLSLASTPVSPSLTLFGNFPVSPRSSNPGPHLGREGLSSAGLLTSNTHSLSFSNLPQSSHVPREAWLLLEGFPAHPSPQ